MLSEKQIMRICYQQAFTKRRSRRVLYTEGSLRSEKDWVKEGTRAKKVVNLWVRIKEH